MKREDLKALGMTDEHIEGVMKLHGADETAHATALKAKEDEVTEVTGKLTAATTQIGTLNEEVKKFDGSISSVEFQTKMDELKDTYESQIASKDKDFATELLFKDDKLKFSSELAKQAAIASFKEKDLTFENGKFLGSDDFFKGLKESDPSAFQTEENADTKNASIFVNTGGKHSAGGGVSAVDAMRSAAGLPVTKDEK